MLMAGTNCKRGRCGCGGACGGDMGELAGYGGTRVATPVATNYTQAEYADWLRIPLRLNQSRGNAGAPAIPGARKILCDGIEYWVLTEASPQEADFRAAMILFFPDLLWNAGQLTGQQKGLFGIRGSIIFPITAGGLLGFGEGRNNSKCLARVPTFSDGAGNRFPMDRVQARATWPKGSPCGGGIKGIAFPLGQPVVNDRMIEVAAQAISRGTLDVLTNKVGASMSLSVGTAAKGAGLGASVGSVVPGIGTVLGGILGAVGGFFSSAFGPAPWNLPDEIDPYYQVITPARGPLSVFLLADGGDDSECQGAFDIQVPGAKYTILSGLQKVKELLATKAATVVASDRILAGIQAQRIDQAQREVSAITRRQDTGKLAAIGGAALLAALLL